MNITVVAVGTRGDVEPHMALAAQLAGRGHRVTLAAPLDFERQSRALGLTFHRINVGFRDIYGTKEGAALLACDNKSVKFVTRLARLAIPFVAQVIADIREACAGADAVYYSMLGLPAHYIAQDLGVPAYATSLQPLGRTSESPSPLFPLDHTLPSGLNRMTHAIGEQAFWQLYRPLIRKKVKATLPRWGHFNELYESRRPMLFAYSSFLIPRPKDFGSSMHVTGFWRLPLETGWKPPASLVEFLSAGSPPICVGFGSMNSRRIDAMLPLVLQAIAEMGKRAIILTGWWDRKTNADVLTNDIYMTDAVPHSWLFPKVAAVVHHGGAGTTAAALAAGVPSIVMPFFFDQWFWGKCLNRRGLGPAPISSRDLSVAAVKHALGDIEKSAWFRQRLASLSRQLRDEDGVSNAADVIEASSGHARLNAAVAE